MTVNEAIRQIRDIVNKGIFINNIQRHGFVWDMVCASMDMIEDSQLAIESYGDFKNAKTAQQYLVLYGLFQAIFLEQDALVNLAEGLKLSPVNVWKDADLKYVRTIRTKYFGHPSRHTQDSKVSYHGIARITVGNGVIQGWTYPNFRVESIDVAETLKRHTKATEKVLEAIIVELKKKGNKYMSQITDTMPTSDHVYEFEKLYSWAHGSNNEHVMAQASVNILDKELNLIKKQLEDRYDKADRVGDVAREISKAKYCLKVIQKGINDSKIDSGSSFYFEAHIDSLKQTYHDITEVCNDINKDLDSPL